MTTPEHAKRVCAWCQLTLAAGTLPATHGICADCIDKLTDSIPRPLAHDPRD